MIHEYPSYYRTFCCIGGTCPDSCCIGWEVDIDDDTWEYYQSIPGEFGDRLRSHMTDDGEDRFFPMCGNGRCPFLNDRNLCDIILSIGEESLSLVCTEYPRYYLTAGDFEQIDLSLSCMELGRIFFSDPAPIEYIHEEDIVSDDPLDVTHAALLQEILQYRDEAIHLMQDRNVPLNERYHRVFEEFGPDDSGVTAPMSLMDVMCELEVIDERWNREMEEIRMYLPRIPEASDAFREACGSSYEVWFEKLACYFLYRYITDAYFAEEASMAKGEVLLTAHPGVEASVRFTFRALTFIHLMCVARYLANEEHFSVEDMIDLAHLYSKEVEHDEDNVRSLKYRV